MHPRRFGITPSDDDTVTVLVDFSDIGNINRKRLQELKEESAQSSRGSVLSLRGEEILERMVEVVIHNLRRNRDRLLDPDKDLEDSAVRRQLENEKLLRGQYSGRAGTIYALVELKVKMALADYWDRIYEPLEETAIFPKAVSESAVLIVISRLSKSEWATEKVFRYITGIAKTIRDNSRR